jgi:hypothetical protein
MTDARFPERWLNDRRLLRLSDAAFRLFVISLTWSVSNRTDGVLDTGDLTLIPGVNPAAAGELARAGLWMAGGSPSPTAAPWLIIEFASTQTSSSELQILTNARRREREKKRRQRARVLGDVPGEVSPGTAQDRLGQARRPKVKSTGFQPSSARTRPMFAEPKATPPGATATHLLRRKLAGESTTARTPMVLTFNTSLSRYIPRAKPQTVTRARPAPSAA